MTSEEIPQPQTEQMPAPGFVGQQLRKAREAAGLSIEQVAENQHLRPTIIQSIENGDYHHIDSELFLKGYVRVYAGQVGLDPDRLMRLLDGELEPLRRRREEAIEANPLHDIEQRKRQKLRIARGVVISVLVVVLVLIGVYFYAERAGIDLLGAGPSAPVAEQQAQQTAPPTEEGVPGTVSGSDMSAPVVSSGTGSDMANGEPSAADVPVGEPVQPEQSLSADQPVTASAEPSSPVGDQPVTQTYEDTKLNGAVSKPAPINDGIVRLKISFSDKCWVQVSDGRGRTILAALKTAADQVDVTGVPPLKVIFGATNAVADVEFEGQQVDMSKYSVVNNRAEFTLGQ